MAQASRSAKEIMKQAGSYLTVRNFYRLFAFIMIISGAGFYLGWSIAYDTWTDIGLYSFAVPLILFGILLLALDLEKHNPQEKNSE
ncbi:conserved hypothetical protein, membrane [mine drainage metagenome]|uniref:DUF3098 domain-containing protein n=1 Tax=mine drainage metagenome TaxID=410659 RepID=T0ZHK5_9ZZZZ